MENENVFGGKVVLIYLVNAPESFSGGIPVVNPTIEEKEGRKFVIGHLPNNTNDWSSGLPIGVAMDQIAHYLTFASEEDFANKSEFAWLSSGSLH
ncbi:MAG: hypothetical protein QNJ22_08810 [Desulfosarcinaceae bacterium]|nr:hypothetical protein [Desulfosarcinaceae bacterium]